MTTSEIVLQTVHYELWQDLRDVHREIRPDWDPRHGWNRRAGATPSPA